MRLLFFFFQAEDGIRDVAVTGVQTCALPISAERSSELRPAPAGAQTSAPPTVDRLAVRVVVDSYQIGRASCRERGEISGGAVSLKKKNGDVVGRSERRKRQNTKKRVEDTQQI